MYSTESQASFTDKMFLAYEYAILKAMNSFRVYICLK